MTDKQALDLAQLLRSCDIFADLPPDALDFIGSQGELVKLESQSTLFKQGDPSDSVYLVFAGLLQAIVMQEAGGQRLIGEISQGQVFGELGALSGAGRSLTVSSLTNCTLFRIEKEKFVVLCHKYAAIPLAILNPIIFRAQKTIQLLAKKKITRRVLVIPANSQTDILPFMDVIKTQIGNSELVNFEFEGDEAKSSAAEQSMAPVLNIARHDGAKWALYLCPQVQEIFVIANDHKGQKADFSGEAFQTLSNSPEFNNRRVHLILLHSNTEHAPFANLNEWLKEFEFHMVHHANIQSAGQMASMKRFLLGRPIGLVLGGGAAKGWAHIGVVKCLADNNVPFDVICGTSIGGIVAACFSFSTSYEQLLYLFDILSTQIISRLRYTLPTISIFSAKAPTEILQRVFGETEMADLALPLFVVSSNLYKRSDVIHKQGKVWQALRATASLPGFVPPMVFNGELHVDGGLLNNVPVRATKQWLGDDAKIIAVDIGAASNCQNNYKFPPVLTFGQLLLRKLKLKYRNFHIPRLFETFWESLMIGSAAFALEQLKEADIAISPDMTGYSMLDEKPATRQKLIKLGYETTAAQLKTKLNVDKWI